MPEPPILAHDSYQDVVPILKATSPAFASSPEYAPVADNDDLPGVILAAYAQYLIRLCANRARSDEVEKGIAAINALHGVHDYRIRNSIRDEFVEAFDDAPEAIELIRPLLSESLAAEFRRR